MSESVDAASDGINFKAELDFETKRWASSAAPPEAEFPFVVQLGSKRYELYSDETFAEVEETPD